MGQHDNEITGTYILHSYCPPELCGPDYRGGNEFEIHFRCKRCGKIETDCIHDHEMDKWIYDRYMTGKRPPHPFLD
jgi:hypothetical protein